MANICPLPGLCMTLSDDMTADNDQLCLPSTYQNKVLDALGGDKYTYLVVSNGVSCEYVKVQVDTSDPSKLVMIDRGLEWTTPSNFSKGSSVKFEWFTTAMEDMLECLNTIENPEICIEGMEWDTDEQCYKPTQESESNTITFKDCQYQYTIKNVDVDRVPLPATQTLNPGTYKNACVVVGDDGCITSISEGDDAALSGSGCGCCGKCNGGCEETVAPNPLVACQAGAPSLTSNYILWINTLDACLYVKCDNTWISTGQRVQPPS